MGSEGEAVQRGTESSHKTERETPLKDELTAQEGYASSSVLNAFQNSLTWGDFVCGCSACLGMQR